MRDPNASRRRWPLLLIASPAAVAVWSGWVALGAMCGFGPVNLLPGIGAGFTLNTAITLPVGVEAYGAYALGAWLIPGAPERARKFAMRSAVGALVLGMGGQVIYHLLAAAHAARAPWPVVVVVACMPVVTLGFGAALTHLLHQPAAPGVSPWPRPAPLMEAATESLRSTVPERSETDHRASSMSTAQSDSAPPAGDVTEVTPKSSAGASRSASRKRRAASPRATDDELAELVLSLFGGPDEVKKYGVIKAIRDARGIGIGDERAGRILELARRRHRAQRVVPIERKR
jgi:hypothetical protein